VVLSASCSPTPYERSCVPRSQPNPRRASTSAALRDDNRDDNAATVVPAAARNGAYALPVEMAPPTDPAEPASGITR